MRDVGLFVVRTATLTARRAGLPPRLVEVPGGLLHAVDRENPGIDEVIQRHAPAWRDAVCAVALSVAAGTTAELRRLMRKVEGRRATLGIDAYELDLTAPCDALDGAPFESSLDESARIIDVAREATDLPLIAKFSPTATSMSRLVSHCADAGADIASISPEVSGNITQVLVAENAHVTKGQPLVMIDDTTTRIMLAGAEAQLRAAVSNIEGAKARYREKQQTLALSTQQKALGAISALDLAAVQAAAQTARLNAATARSQVAQDLNALRLLLGTEPPADLLPSTGPNALDQTAQATALLGVPADLPSSVLLRRPDVMAAEFTLQANDANVAAARAALFPTVSLTAAAGTASTALSGLFAAGNGTWSVAPALSLPIFDWGSRQAAIDTARANQQAQLASYEKTLQTAFQEVANALAVRAQLDERLDAQTQQVQAYAQALKLTETRRALGAESALTVLEAQRSYWSARQSLIALRLAEQSNRLTLFKALGGA